MVIASHFDYRLHYEEAVIEVLNYYSNGLSVVFGIIGQT